MNTHTNIKTQTGEWAEAFIKFLLSKLEDKGVMASLRRADNPNTEHQSWPYLIAFNVNLENTGERFAFLTVAAALAKARIEKNGISHLGHCLAACNKDNNKSFIGEMRLRRLLGCRSVEEVCHVLRPLLSFISEKSSLKLDYAHLLQDLLKFRYYPQAVKASWAQSFYQGAISA